MFDVEDEKTHSIQESKVMQTRLVFSLPPSISTSTFVVKELCLCMHAEGQGGSAATDLYLLQ